ncbi:MAG: hypothetical protein ACRDJC_15090, partial [Thermomicrobiales bacterium]
ERPDVIDSSHDNTTPFDGATPRRQAVRTIGAAGTALLGVVGLGTAARTKGKNRSVGADHKKKRRKKCKCKAIERIGLTSAESEPFSVGANEGVTERVECPHGFIAISGGLEGVSEVTAPCMIRESHDEPDGSAWVVNVFCTKATNTELRVGVICFSRNSFRLQG